MNYIDYNKMDKEKLDIVNLINNSPLTKLSKGFHSTLIERIQKSFTDDEQQIFVASFYSYLNYNSKTDFNFSKNSSLEISLICASIPL